MPYIYLAGPVLPSATGYERGLEELYRDLGDVARAWNFDVLPPLRDPSVDKLDERQFSATMAKRIRASAGVVTTITRGDSSVPVEAGFAAGLGKPQLILAFDSKDVPRIMKGLPGIIGIAPARRGDIKGAMEKLVHAMR